MEAIKEKCESISELLYEENIADLLKLIDNDEQESLTTLHLTANENVISKTAQSLLSSTLSCRYHLGTPDDYQLNKIVKKDNLIFKGLPGVYALEKVAKNISHSILEAIDSDFRPLSGVHGLICTIATATKLNDLIYSICPEDGGHFATRNIIEKFGRRSKLMKFDRSKLNIDLDHLKKLVKLHPPQAMIFDHGATIFEFPLKEIRSIVGNETLIIFDASHPLGLIYGNVFPNPLKDGCDILQGNTHKTFPGPQKGLIFFKEKQLSEKVIDGIGRGMVSSQHTHHSISLYITLLEMAIYGNKYAKQIISNALSLAKYLKEMGFEVLTSDNLYTVTNIIFIEAKDMSEANEICNKLHQCNISTNARPIFGKALIRLGVQEITRRGMKESEMYHIASLIKFAIKDNLSSNIISSKVKNFLDNFSKIHYSFDSMLINS